MHLNLHVTTLTFDALTLLVAARVITVPPFTVTFGFSCEKPNVDIANNKQIKNDLNINNKRCVLQHRKDGPNF